MSNEHITLHTQALAANPDLAFFWEATKKESMLLPHCADCGKTHLHPRLFCPFCFSNKLEWKESAGKATLYAATTLSKVSEPYIVAYVELAEGPLMLTNIVDCSLDELQIGAPLTLTFSPMSSGHFLPVFRLAK